LEPTPLGFAVSVLANPLFSVASFLLGLLVGNRLAISRDRRKERNDAAQVVRAALMVNLDRPSPMDRSPGIVDLDLLEQRLPRWRRSGFRKAIAHYKESRARYKQDSAGGAYYDDVITGQIIESIHRLLAYTRAQ
jgi:hypothetical protein